MTRPQVPKEKIAALCRRHHIQKLSFFGSILTSHFGPTSDIDILVEFQPTHTPGFIGLARIERELSELFDGRPIDLRTPQDLSRYFRDQVLAQSQVQYAA
jgi:uncharacterized protein